MAETIASLKKENKKLKALNKEYETQIDELNSGEGGISQADYNAAVDVGTKATEKCKELQSKLDKVTSKAKPESDKNLHERIVELMQDVENHNMIGYRKGAIRQGLKKAEIALRRLYPAS